MLVSKKRYLLFVCICLVAACKPTPEKQEEKKAEENTETITTPVTLTSPINGNLSEAVELNAVSAFLLKSYVKSSSNGYLQEVNATLGKYVNKGDLLFLMKTKESQSLGNTISKLDTSLHFSGVIAIKAPGTGYISQINYRAGDYVQDGEQMAVITDTRSFVFLLDLPYELKPYLSIGQNVQLKLPDATTLDGTVSNAMPTVDAVSQTQSFVIKVNSAKQIPENLIAKVSLIKNAKSNTISLLKSAVLSDETQTEFWIMQLIDSVTAVKVRIKKGLENATNVEIVSPALKLSDKIILTGNYGLPDTAKVTIIQK
jgi:multidrug efflux pump subunit AcrA (membrane-fusion protein)